MKGQNRKGSGPRNRRRVPLAALGLVSVIAVMLIAIAPARQYFAQRAQLEEAETQLAGLRSERVSLQAEAAALATPLEIERRARAELGFVRPGEQPYVIAPDPDAATAITPPPSPPSRRWWDGIVDFVTGRDQI